MLVQGKYDTLSLAFKLFLSLFSNTAMAYGFQLMLMFEGTGEGKQLIFVAIHFFCFMYSVYLKKEVKDRGSFF